MVQQLETDVRDILRLQAAGIPAGAAERLTGIDYRQRPRRLTPTLAVSGVGVTAATATSVCLAVLTGAPPAWAGWSARPAAAAASPARTMAASSDCVTQLGQEPGVPPGTQWTPVVTDVRGPFTLLVEESSPWTATCLTGPSVNAVSVSDGESGGGTVQVSGGGQGEHVSSSSGAEQGNDTGVERFASSLFNDPANGAYAIADGQVASDVSAVTLVLADGTDVETTIGGGWFVAWWPGNENAVAADVTTPSSVSVQELGSPPNPHRVP